MMLACAIRAGFCASPPPSNHSFKQKNEGKRPFLTTKTRHHKAPLRGALGALGAPRAAQRRHFSAMFSAHIEVLDLTLETLDRIPIRGSTTKLWTHQ